MYSLIITSVHKAIHVHNVRKVSVSKRNDYHCNRNTEAKFVNANHQVVLTGEKRRRKAFSWCKSKHITMRFQENFHLFLTSTIIRTDEQSVSFTDPVKYKPQTMSELGYCY